MKGEIYKVKEGGHMLDKYWYYVIGRINKEGESKTSDGICSSIQKHFPLGQIMDYWKDEYGSTGIYVKYSVRISKEDFNRMYENISKDKIIS